MDRFAALGQMLLGYASEPGLPVGFHSVHRALSGHLIAGDDQCTGERLATISAFSRASLKAN